MSNNINLVQGENTENLETKKRVIILRWISIVFLFSVAFFSIILFILSNRISVESVKAQEESATQKLNLSKENFIKFNLLNDRLKGISNIISTRKNYPATLNAILAQIPSGSTITGFNMSKDEILITVSSNSLLILDKFLTNITNVSSDKHVMKDVVIEGLVVVKQTGIYSLSLKAKPL